jgi:signal transduction histidine kinase/CheY-like chemotaxis protein
MRLNNLYIKPKEFRTGIILGALLYSLFGVVDQYMMPLHYKTAWLVRFFIVLPGILALIGFSFSKRIMNYARLLLILLAVVGQLGINYMILISDPSEGAYWGYYAGLIIIILWSGFIFRFTFYETIFIFISTLFFYNMVAIAHQGLLAAGTNSEKFKWFVGNNYFLISAGIIATVGAHQLEKYQKKLEEETKKHKEARNIAEESDRLKSAFLANMSHEIRTPMNSILGFSELLKKPGLTEERKNQFAAIVTSSGEQLLRIIDDVIDISKIESNQLTLKKQNIKLNDVLNEFITSQAQHMTDIIKQHIKIELRLPKGKRVVFLYTDPIRFMQIISNLVSNALKNTDEGYIEIGYDLITESLNEYVRFYVKDTGIGIPEEKFGLIFERFGQINTSRPVKGTGLGLSITKGLVNLLGGDVWVKSDINKGSTFYFTLPYASNQDMAEERKEEKMKTDIPDFSGKTVYIAEDDMISFLFIQEILAETKIDIKHALNGKDLISMLKEKQPEIILLDINMPVMNGYEAVAEIRKINNNIPVIAQTAYALEDEREKCLNAGCTDYISKPLSGSILIEKIGLYINKARK